MTISPPPPPLQDCFERESPGVAAFLRRHLPYEAVADALQETLLRAWRSRGQFDTRRPPGPWLLAIARRVLLDRARRHAGQPSLQNLNEVPDHSDGDPARHAEDRDLLVAIANAVERLSEPSRSVFKAFYQEGATVDQIADRQGLPLNTVKSHLHRARRRISTSIAADNTNAKAKAKATKNNCRGSQA